MQYVSLTCCFNKLLVHSEIYHFAFSVLILNKTITNSKSFAFSKASLCWPVAEMFSLTSGGCVVVFFLACNYCTDAAQMPTGSSCLVPVAPGGFRRAGRDVPVEKPVFL